MAKKVTKKTSKKAKQAKKRTAPKETGSAKSKKVTFRYAAPDAAEVLLAACFTKCAFLGVICWISGVIRDIIRYHTDF